MARFLIESYGCQMNSAESDSLRSVLKAGGHIEVSKPEDAEVAIMNTCSVRKTAEERVFGRLEHYKAMNKNREMPVRVVLMGCMAQSLGERIADDYPELIGLVWGTYNKDEIVGLIDEMGDGFAHLETEDYRFLTAQAQRQFPFRAFVPISHGCDNYCSYCIVPMVRGREISRGFGEIKENIERLVDQGVFDITLLGQNVNSYIDRTFEIPQRFSELLDAVASIRGVERLSFMTSHPKDFDKTIVEAMKAHSNIMSYLHLPVQSGSNRILELMNRKYTREKYLEKLEWARTIPDLVLSSDILVGFPGETESEFMETMDLIEKVRYYEAFMYYYNPRPETRAVEFDNDVPRKEKLRRLDYLVQRQNAITKEVLMEYSGKTYRVILEAVSRRNRHLLHGKTENGLNVYVEGKPEEIGNIVLARLENLAGKGMSAVRV